MRVLFVFLLIPMVALAAQSYPGKIRLRAHRGKVVYWELELVSSSPEKCSITLSGPNIAKPRTLHPDARECRDFSVLAGHLPSVPTEAPEPIFDEPQYEFQVRGRRIEVAFRTAEECELLKGGKMNCRPVELSAAQKLLIPLRAVASGSK